MAIGDRRIVTNCSGSESSNSGGQTSLSLNITAGSFKLIPLAICNPSRTKKTLLAAFMCTEKSFM